MPQTLEQRRAADAWQKAQGCTPDYKSLAKRAPALIMNSGLMQTLAFFHEKSNQDHYRKMGGDLRGWLHQRFPDRLSEDFASCMDDLLGMDARTFQEVTAEAFAWLRWLRQFAAAAGRKEEI